MLNLKNITLEGPDLSGKTTLMSQIHKETNNKYNFDDTASCFPL